MRVLASSGRVAVRVEVLDHPEIQAGRHRKPLERADDRQAGALIAVDASDDEQLVAAVWVAELDGVDGAALNRVTEDDATSVGACGQGQEKSGDCRGTGVHDGSGSPWAAERRLN